MSTVNEARTQYETLFYEEPTAEELEQLCYMLMNDIDYEWLYDYDEASVTPTND